MLPHIWRAGRSGSLIALPQHKPGAWLTADLSNTGGGGGVGRTDLEQVAGPLGHVGL